MLVTYGWAPSNETASFDHLVCEREQLGRNVDLERLGGREIKDQLVFRRQLDGQIARLGPFEDAADKIAGAARGIYVAPAIAHQPARLDVVALCEARRQRMARGERHQLASFAQVERAGTNKQSAGTGADDRFKRSIDLAVGRGS